MTSDKILNTTLLGKKGLGSARTKRDDKTGCICFNYKGYLAIISFVDF